MAILLKTEPDRLAEMILARINTRENSTLTFATVAASAALILLQFAVSGSGLNYHPWLRLAGFGFAMLGILYRETTILTIDQSDYSRLYRLVPSLRSGTRKGGIARGLFIRSLLLTSLAATMYLVSNSVEVIATRPLGINDYLPVILVVLFWLIFLPGLRFCKRLGRALALAGFVPVIAAFLIVFSPLDLLQFIPTTVKFAFAGGLYVVASSLLLTMIERTSYK